MIQLFLCIIALQLEISRGHPSKFFVGTLIFISLVSSIMESNRRYKTLFLWNVSMLIVFMISLIRFFVL